MLLTVSYKFQSRFYNVCTTVQKEGPYIDITWLYMDVMSVISGKIFSLT